MFDITQEKDYRELTLEEQYLVNGGAAMDQRDQAAMAAAQEKGDQAAMDAILAKYETPKNDSVSGGKTTYGTGTSGNPGTGSGNGGVTGSGGNNNTSTSSGGPSGNPGGSGPDSAGSDNRGYPSSMDGYYDAKLKKLHEYNPDETNTDKKFTARDFNGKHLMTVYYANGVKFEDAAAYYLSFGKWGTAETTTYDGIGLTDENGNVVHVLTEETAIKNYADSFNPKRIKIGREYSRVENNQLKTEKDLYLEAKSSKNGWNFETGVTKVNSKTLVQGPAGETEFNFMTAEAAWINSPDYSCKSAGINAVSWDFEIGLQSGDKRFTIGGGIGFGVNLGYKKSADYLKIDFGPFKNLHFTSEW